MALLEYAQANKNAQKTLSFYSISFNAEFVSPTYSHIVLGSRKSFCNGINQFTGYTKVAQFKLSLASDENIGWLNVCYLQSQSMIYIL